MQVRAYGDEGQAFPIYITVVGALLFLSFAYFAVGQAAVNRNGAQTAADAAALAAAQDRRDQLANVWVDNLLEPDNWQEVFDGQTQGLGTSCWRASQFAAQNGAVALSCLPDGPMGYTVSVETNDPVGDSLVPGTENMKSQAEATAVIEARCEIDPLVEGRTDDTLPLLTCENRKWELDPKAPELLPKPEDLFGVYLAN